MTQPVQESVRIDAPPAVVWGMVSDPTRMPEWSPELTAARWVSDVHEPRVGARFKGSNRHGVFRWSTSCEVIAAEPEQVFSYRVRSVFGLPVSQWSFRIAPTDGGCELTEATTDERGAVMRVLGPTATGVGDRVTHNLAGIRATLAAIKAAAERATAVSD
jgi:uncharacterized protein YndB with AHSA1/START domain